VTWYLCDMDDGILRAEPTKRAAKDWFRGWADTPRVNVHRVSAGDYYLTAAYDGGMYATSAFLMTAEVTARHAFDPGQRPLYPSAEHPYERVDRDEWEMPSHA